MVVEAIEVELLVVQAMIVEEMDFFIGVVGIVDMEEVVEDRIVWYYC